MPQTLRDIADLIRQHQAVQARQALYAYLDSHPDQAEAWYLLSWVETDRPGKIEALDQALQLDPDNPKYQKRQAKLVTTPPTPSRGRKAILLLPIAGLVMALALLVAFLSSGDSQTAVIPPTRVVLGVSPEASEIVANTEIPVETTAIAPLLTATVVPATTIAPIELSPVILSPEAMPTMATATPSSLMPTNTPVVPTASGSPTVVWATIIPAPLTAPANTSPSFVTMPPEITNTSAPPTATLNPQIPTPAGAIPLGMPMNIGTGEMRVVSAARPANEVITSFIAAAPPNPPANHSWLLVELFLICSGTDNCAPPAGSLTVMGNSQALYQPSTVIPLFPQFGSDSFAVGQVWGYLIFAIPNAEQGIWLKLQLVDGTIYYFALQ